MREFSDLPPEARSLMQASLTLLKQHLIENLVAAGHDRADNEALADLILTFFSGVCILQNLGPSVKEIDSRIGQFMKLIRRV
jgi:TetR/AcrR family transcriptional regulator, copper-responsive repressor